MKARKYIQLIEKKSMRRKASNFLESLIQCAFSIRRNIPQEKSFKKTGDSRN